MMLLGLDASLWKSLLVILVCPVIVVGLLNVLLRKRGGIWTDQPFVDIRTP